MKKLIRIGLILFGIGVVSALGTYIYVFHKPHRNIEKEKPAYILKAEELYSHFTEDENGSYVKYGDQVLQVSGEVVDISVEENGANMVYLSELEGINCAFDSVTVVKEGKELKNIRVGNQVTVKGKCDGYDMIMGVVLTRCVVLDVKAPAEAALSSGAGGNMLN